MTNQLLRLAVISFWTTGCSASAPTEIDQSTTRLSLFGQKYASYLAAHNGAAPPNEERLKKFFESENLPLDKLGMVSRDDLFRSPRDNEPLVVMYGKQSMVEGPGGLPWVAHERTGIEGMRYAIGARGSVELMSAEQIEKIFP